MIQRHGGETAGSANTHAFYNVSQREGSVPTEISRTDMQGFSQTVCQFSQIAKC